MAIQYSVLAVEYITRLHEFCLDQDNTPYCKTTTSNGTLYTPLHSADFARLLCYNCHLELGFILSSSALKETTGLLSSLAEYEGERIITANRTFQQDGKVYISLDGTNQTAYMVDADGYRKCTTPPVVFIPSPTTNPLPDPTPGGKLQVLKQLLNLGSEEAWLLVLTYIVHSLMGFHTKTILLLQGERGSGKSTTSKVIGAMIDPSKMPLQDIPQGTRNLMIAANNSYLLVLDNQGKITTSVSNDLCRLATGGGFRHRRNYADTDEVYINVTRPQIINGIDHELITAPDLISRSIPISLPHMEDQQRMSEDKFWITFNGLHAALMGDVFQLISQVLKLLPEVQTDGLPRLTEYCRVGCALENILGYDKGTFLTAFDDVQKEALETASEVDVLSHAIVQFMDRRADWTGTATDLFKRLGVHQPFEVTRDAKWPRSARSLGKRLRGIESMLASQGIHFTSHHSGKRTLTLTNSNRQASTSILEEFEA